MKDLLQKAPFWEFLTDAEKEMLETASMLKHYEAGKILHGNCDGGDSCLGMLYMVSGEIRVYMLSEEGREITLLRMQKGDSSIFSALCVMSHIDFDTQLTVTKDADVLIIPPFELGKLLEQNVHVRCYMYETASRNLSTVVWVMQQIIFSSFDRRLAAFLLREYEKSGSAVICMTQEQIAQDVNSAREVVTRMLKQFATEGLIENRRGKIVLKDIAGLRRISPD